ncbi:MAG: ECF transporter S component, partial [Candidatus Bathyarchaeia archaeon]
RIIGVDIPLLDLVGLIAIAILGFRSGSLLKEKPMYRPTVRLSSFEVACTAIFSALTAVATAFTGQFFPSPTGGYTHIGDTVIFISALMLGPKLGALIGVVGAVAADIYVGYSRWFVSIPAHGLEGFIAGLGRGRRLYVQIALCAVGGVVMATTYFYVNIFIKGLAPALISLYRDVFGQVAVSLILTALLKPALTRISPKKF